MDSFTLEKAHLKISFDLCCHLIRTDCPIQFIKNLSGNTAEAMSLSAICVGLSRSTSKNVEACSHCRVPLHPVFLPPAYEGRAKVVFTGVCSYPGGGGG